MNPVDQLKAFVRTIWPAIVAQIAALIVTYLGDKMGIEVNSNAVFGVVTVVLLAAIYGAGRWLEKRDNAYAAGLGRWLVSLGMDLGQPTYVKQPDGRPLSGTPPGR